MDGTIFAFRSYDNGHIMNLLSWNSDENKYLKKWEKKFTPEDWFICANCRTLDISDDGSTIKL